MVVGRADGQQSPSRTSVSIDYSSFGNAAGAGYGSRLRLVRLPNCALTSPGKKSCQTATALPTVNDTQHSRLTADTGITVDGTVLAAVAGPSGSAGNYAATSLSPSSMWQVSPQTGSFTWSYPLRVPPSPAGPSPQLTLTYDSQQVDGRTAATNNQPSWIGDGWDMWPGYLERSYKTCAVDAKGDANNVDHKTTDECWGTDNATLSLNGHSSELVKDDTTGDWRMRSDDGSRIEHLTGASNGDNDGEYWRVTTVDGTRYYFGRNHLTGWSSGDAATNSAWSVPVYGNNPGEPCHATAFSDSSCQQAWRWNLDYVVDPHGNAVSYRYAAESGYYGRGGDASARTKYTRGGYLAEADYGFGDGHAYDTDPSAKVLFTVADRCAPDTTCDTDHPASWPDTPWDQACLDSTCTNKYTPVFYTGKMLATVTTQVRNGSTYRNVDRWSLDHSFLDTGDNDAKPLWLGSITHTGLNGGSQALPPVVFDGTQMANRVDTDTDGLSALNRYRLTAITSESGGVTTIGYSDPQCTAGTTMPSAPDADTLRCMPSYWYPPGEDKKLDYFHKYVATEVRVHDPFGGSPDEDTFYDYEGSPAWHYNDTDLIPAASRTWSQWRGYSKVVVRHGAVGTVQSATRYLYLRGMDGDRQSDGSKRSVTVTDSQGGTITDSDKLQGFQREAITYDGVDGVVLGDTVSDPWTHGPTATQTHDGYSAKAWMRATATTTTRSRMADGSWGVKLTTTSYNEDGLPMLVDDRGDTTTAADDKCVRTTYTSRNTSAWILNRVAQVETDAVPCSNTATKDQVVSHTRSYYDGSTTLGAKVSRGDVTEVEALTSWNGDTPGYSTSETLTYDAAGRATSTTDPLGRTTTTTFTPTSGGPVTGTTVTNPMGYSTTTTLEPATGQTLSTVDTNGRRTEVTYDPLGRISAAWLPGRVKGTDDPSVKYVYDVRNDAASTITTQTLAYGRADHVNALRYVTSIALYDGLLRERQTQTPAPGGGRMITDTLYDSRGLVKQQTDPYYNDQTPSEALVGTVGEPEIPALTKYTYDGSERQTAAIFVVNGNEKWRTSTAYPGADRTDVTPPSGGTPTTTIVDARGQTVELRQYHGGTATGTYDATHYTYTPAGHLASVTDSAGNVWRYTYDVRGYKTTTTDPDTGTSTAAYDNAGQVTTATDARGVTVAYSYDKLGRRTGEYLDSTNGTQLAEWVYDTLPGGKGLLTSSTRYADGDAYTEAVTGYDGAGRPTGTSVTIPSSQGALAGTYTDSTTYNADGSVATTTLPAAGDLPAEKLVYHNNELGQPTTMYSGLVSYVYDLTYNHDGSLSQRVLGDYGSRVFQDYTYETGTRRLTKADAIPELKGYASNVSYTYNPAGDVTKAVDNPDGDPDTQCFRFDYLDRLTDAWTPRSTGADGATPGSCASLPAAVADLGGPAAYWHTYAYDATGNRTRMVEHLAGQDTTVSSNYPAPGASHPHALSSTLTTTSVGVGSTATEQNTYTYDAAGNTTSRTIGGDTQTLTWDSDGNLATFTTATGNATSYVYDADGNQLIRHDPDGSTTLWLPDGTELHVGQGDTRATATRYYSHLGATIAVRTAAALTWLVDDPNGTATVEIDGKTLGVTHRYSDPFGRPRSAVPDWIGDRGFVGGTQDPNTGLTNLGAREYDPTTGRFLSADPIADTSNPQQLNGYAYANNSPVVHNDASGQMLACGGLGGSDPGLACMDGSTTPTGNNSDYVWMWPAGSDSTPLYDYVGPHGTTLQHNHDGSYTVNGVVIPYDGPTDALAFARAVDNATAQWQKSHHNFPDAAGQSTSDVLNMMLHACQSGGPGMCSESFRHAVVENIQILNAPRRQKQLTTAEKITGYLGLAMSMGAMMGDGDEGGSRGGRSGSRSARARALGGDDYDTAGICHSFPANTRVKMANGSDRPIENIKIGQYILNAYPGSTHSQIHRVDGVIVSSADDRMVDLSLSTHAGVKYLTTTAHHLIWDVTQQQWVEASKIRIGDRLQGAGGRAVRVVKIVRYVELQLTYDLVIDQVHTYYVEAGASVILVHNKGDEPLTGPQQSQLAKYLGWRKVNGQRSHGQAVFTDGKYYYSYDVDSHNGGVWKRGGSLRDLGKKETRNGTFSFDGKSWVHC